MRPDEAPLVTVIVPTYESEASLDACLQALERQTLGADRVEVLVVDNGTRRLDQAMRARHAGVHWLTEEVPGSYAARNRGIAAARGDVLAFTDADCVPEPSWLERGLAALQADPSLGVVAGKVVLFAKDARRPRGAELWDIEYGIDNETFHAKQQFGATANLVVRRSVMETVGPFDAKLKSGGDRDWGRRAAALGIKQAFVADVVVLHPARRTLRAVVAKARRVTGGRHASGLLPGGKALVRRWASNTLPPWHLGPVLRRISHRHGRLAALRFYGATYVRRLVGVGEELRIRLGGRPRR